MSLIFCGLSPHPPLLVPAIGRDNLQQVLASQAGLREMSRTVVERKPDAVVIVTPHGPVRIDAVSMLSAERFEASFRDFDEKYELRGDTELAAAMIAAARADNFPIFSYPTFDSYKFHFSRGLDHASMVPLFYLKEAGLDVPMVFISIAAWSHREHYRFGVALQKALDGGDKRIAFIASGDLSHRLIPSASAGYEPRGIEFDNRVVDALVRMDTKDVLDLDDAFIERIGECGLRPISMMLGTLEGRAPKARVLSYEGPFGVGYCVAEIEPGPKSAPVCAEEPEPEVVLDLVKRTVEHFVRGEDVAGPVNVPNALRQRAGAFVCLKKGGQLRGCIGTTQPTQTSLAEELVQNAVSACSRDPRFPPVTPAELDQLEYSVDVLDAPEMVASVDDLDPHKYGVIVRSGYRSGVLLPNLDGVDDAQMQVDIARQKAGIKAGDACELMRFKVRRYEPSKD